MDSIKKVVVPPEDTPELDWFSEGYLLRYRVKTQNKNLSSHWSPIYYVPAPDFSPVEGSFSEVEAENEKTLINVVWDDFLDYPSYDIFVSFTGGEKEGDEFIYDNDSFFYHGSSLTHNYSFVKREGATSVRIVVQPSTNIKRIKERFIIFDSNI
jgi:hypothetical protein